MCCGFLILALLGPRFFGAMWWLVQPARWQLAFTDIIGGSSLWLGGSTAAVKPAPACTEAAQISWFFLHHLMSWFLLSQILVAVAIGFDLLSFQFKERRRIIACLIVSCVLIAGHFALLGHWTATGLALLAVMRLLAGYLTTAGRVMLFFIAASLIVTALTFHGILSVLGCLGSIFGTIGSFCREDKRLRQAMMAATSLWLVHNCLAGTPTAVLMEALFLGSNIVGFYRFYLRQLLIR